MTERMTTERLTQAQLEAIGIRARLAAKFKTTTHPHWYENQTYGQLAEDIPALLAEVERLRTGLEEITVMGRSLRKESNAVILLGRIVDKAREAIRNDNDVDWVSEQAEQAQDLLAEVERLQIAIDVTDQSAEAVESDNERLRTENAEYKVALMSIAHGNTWVAHPHDIAAWALGLEKDGDNE